jgi:hypothetical protein
MIKVSAPVLWAAKLHQRPTAAVVIQYRQERYKFTYRIQKKEIPLQRPI